MLRILARIIAAVLALLFVLAAVFTLFARPIGAQMLVPQTYKQVLREKQIAERLPEIAADTVAKAARAARQPGGSVERADDFAGFLDNFSEADLRVLFGALLPADYVRTESERVIDQFFSYLNSDVARPTVRLSLVDLKKRLAGGVLEDAYIQVLQSKPPCPGEVRTLPAGCCPPAELLPEVRARFREMMAQPVREMPDSVDLFAVRDGPQAERVFAVVGKLRSRVQWSVTAARWVWVVPVLLLLGIAIFAVRSFRGLLLWWGLPCLIAGGIALACAVPGAAMGDLFFRLIIKPQIPADVPVLAVESVLGLVTATIQVVLGAALKGALWLATGGLAAVVLAFFCRSKPKTAA